MSRTQFSGGHSLRYTLLGCAAVLAACAGQQSYESTSGAAATAMASSGDRDTTMERILRGRQLVITHACGDCHGGGNNPDSPLWLSGARTEQDEFKIGPFTTRPRNLTPDNLTGLGRFTERQIFNLLRFGLRPGETPDVEITSTVPGQGNFPETPKYVAVPMPWPSWRHMSDQELRDIAAYLKRGLKPVSHKVEDSEGPPDFWASAYTEENIGAYPAKPFPTAAEEVRN